MYEVQETIDDLLNVVLTRLLEQPASIQVSRSETGGNCRELRGCMLKLLNPRARLSRTETKSRPFSALGELCWYLSGSNKLEFIQYYIEAYKKEVEPGTDIIHGAYGPRLLAMDGEINQIENVVNLLQERPTSRRAVIQLFKAEDISYTYTEIPCTCTLQFFVRDGKLEMMTSMRSNDAFLGLPHDIFCFTMIQEIIASRLSCELGTYTHSVGSLHLYERYSIGSPEKYLHEGFQQTGYPMPAMPHDEVISNLNNFLEIEEKIRTSAGQIEISSLNSYWQDLARLLQFFKYKNDEDLSKMKVVRDEILDPVYRDHIRRLIK